jgi:hypothetical protein
MGAVCSTRRADERCVEQDYLGDRDRSGQWPVAVPWGTVTVRQEGNFLTK